MDPSDSNLNEDEFKDDFNDPDPAPKSKPAPVNPPAQQKPVQAPAPEPTDQPGLERYLASLSEKDRKKYLTLLEKNRQLREELKAISESTEQILKKEREKKKARALNGPEERDPALAEKRAALYEQQARIQQLKAEIRRKKAELETTFHSEAIREKEDELNDLRRVHEELCAEKDTLERIRKEQERVLREKGEDVAEGLRKDELLERLREAKTTYKGLVEQKNEREKELNGLHGQVVSEKLALRELQQRARKRADESGAGLQVSEADIEALQAKIGELKARKAGVVEEAQAKLRALERAKKEALREVEVLEQTLKEKDKEMRLNSIKLRELKRLQRHNVLRPIERAEEEGTREKGDARESAGPGLNSGEKENMGEENGLKGSEGEVGAKRSGY